MNWFCYQRGVWVIALIGINYSQLLILGLHIVKVMGECDRATPFWSLHRLMEKFIQRSFKTCKLGMTQAENVPAALSGRVVRDMRISNLMGWKTWHEIFFFLFCSYRSMIMRGIHHSHKGRDNISTFKDGRRFIMRWDKKWVMLMSFWFSVFVRVSVLLYGSWFRAKCKTTFLFSHVEGEVVLKSFEGQV